MMPVTLAVLECSHDWRDCAHMPSVKVAKCPLGGQWSTFEVHHGISCDQISESVISWDVPPYADGP